MDLPPIGARIRLLAMPDDPDPIPHGATGTVDHVNSGLIPQIGVRWDDGRTLFLLPGIDRYEIIG